MIFCFSAMTLLPQSFYMCEGRGKASGFLCPNGTIFNQQYLVCDW